MEIHGWGRYPKLNAQLTLPLSASQCVSSLHSSAPLIAHGLGRSYGDSALSAQVLGTRYLDHFVVFDSSTGILTCEAGVTLDKILREFVTRGWFLPVSPGTRFITVGGAIASDVHGKNHHIAGTFSDYVLRIELMLGNGDRVWVSQTENSELFHATCGGMGLSGIILFATLQLKPIMSSNILQTTLKIPNLEALLEAFEVYSNSSYSVAWIDCLARGSELGRSLLMLGEHATDGPLVMQSKRPISVPIDLPASFLNSFTVKAFNSLYYSRVRKSVSQQCLTFENFFYPLDSIAQWNRLYGKLGFVQYQFVLPKSAGVSSLRTILERITESGKGSFLAVLKVFGPANANYLSFPQKGYTLALDFKVEQAVFDLLDELDAIVLQHGGRIYLAKDARMSAATFKASYPDWQVFEEVRARWYAHGKFTSVQSKRLGLI